MSVVRVFAEPMIVCADYLQMQSAPLASQNQMLGVLLLCLYRGSLPYLGFLVNISMSCHI